MNIQQTRFGFLSRVFFVGNYTTRSICEMVLSIFRLFIQQI